MYLYTFGLTCLFKLFPYALNVGHHNGDVLVVVIVVVMCICRVPVRIGILVMLPNEFVLKLI